MLIENAQTLSTHHPGLPQPTFTAETPAHKRKRSYVNVYSSFYLRGGNSVM